MKIRLWIKKSIPSIKLIICLIIYLSAIESSIVHASQASFHPKLAKMKSFSIQTTGNAIRFGKSKRYQTHGISVVILKGEPYEIGYARGVLLKDEIYEWVENLLQIIKQKPLNISPDENFLKKRAKKIQEFIPREYKEELQGLSAGSGMDYEVLMFLNVLEAISIDFACTSVVVRDLGGSLLRSRNLDLHEESTLPAILYFYKPKNGHGFVSISHQPGFLGTKTAFNENGLSIGGHAIYRTSKEYTEAEPEHMLRRRVAQYANSMEEAGQILNKAFRGDSKMWLVADSKTAGIYEFSQKEIAFKKMVNDYLILTNHTRLLDIGGMSKSSFDRYNEAKTFLLQNCKKMNIKKLIDLNRGNEICFTKYPKIKNLHSAIFKADTLDFWVAIDVPPATRGEWVGFNLHKELYGSGNDPEPLIVPALE